MDKNNDLSKLREVLVKANAQGVDVSELLHKVDSVMGNLQSKTIKIVLMGAFSDGKTTVIAGLTGHLESNMKIAIDESSDELCFYHLPALGYDFEIVDTPGLFGSKERSIEGKQVRYSDITRDYISQAHIVIYVTDARNPLKDSHKDILRYTLRDLGKLHNTIFILNKMDDAGYELSDDEDFNRGSKIKRETFIQRLDSSLNLSHSEKNSMKVICMSANPNGRGLETHFKRMESYLKRSRMDMLRDAVVGLAASSDKESLKASASQSSLTDLAGKAIREFDEFLKKTSGKIEDLQSSYNDTRTRLSRVREIAVTNKGLLQRELKNAQEEIEIDVENATMKNFGRIVSKHFGDEGERLDRTLNQIFSKYAEMNNAAFQQTNIQSSFDKMSDLTEGLVKSASKILKHTKIGADTVKGIRDVIASSYKFKPWGAVNLGKMATKWLNVASLLIDVIMWWKKRAQEKKFEEAKDSLIKSTRDAFKNAESYLSSEKAYFENFAPGVIAVESALVDTENNLKNFKKLKEDILSLRDVLTTWVKNTQSTGMKY